MNKRTRCIILVIFFICMILSALSVRDIIKNGKQYTYHMEQFEFDGSNWKSPETILSKGSYVIQVSYSALEQRNYYIQAGSDQYEEGILPAGENQYVEIPIDLKSDTDACYLKFSSASEEMISLHQIVIVSAGYFDTDGFYFLFLIWTGFVCILLIIKWWQSAEEKSRQAFAVLAFGFVIVNIINYEPVLRFGTDIRVHLLRIEGIRDGLKQGQFPVLLYPKAFNGFGEIGALYPKLFLYPFAILRMMKVSLLVCYKTMMYLINFMTLIIGYYSFRSVLSDGKTLNNTNTAEAGIKGQISIKTSSAVVAVLYTLFPYRMYVMGYSSSALGRGLSMIFLPLMTTGIYHILKGNKGKWWMLAVGMTGILQSHLLNFVISVLFLIVVCLVSWRALLNKRTISELLLAAGVTVFCCAGYLSQLLGYYFSGLNLDCLQFDIYDKLFTPKAFIHSPWNIIAVIYIGIGIHFIRKMFRISREETEKERKNIRFIILLVSVIALLATTVFPWNIFLNIPVLEDIISTFQNTKRFYILINLLIPFFAIVWIMKYAQTRPDAEKFARKGYILLLIVSCLGVVSPAKEYFGCDVLMDRATGYTEHEQIEYLPAGTKPEYYVSNSPVISDESAFHAEAYDKDGAKATFTYTCEKEDVYVELPMFYYDGTRALDENGTPVVTENGTDNCVRIMIPVTTAPKTINVEFYVEPLYKVMTIVSLLSMLLFSVYILKIRGVKIVMADRKDKK